MAVVRNNIFIKGASGMVGKQMLFKTWNGKTFLYTKPKPPKKESPQQKENRTKFKIASRFAKRMMGDPVKKEEYKQKAKKLRLPNAYTAALTEFMRKPEIKNIDRTTYTGQLGDEITIEVRKKDFEVEVVEVILLDEKGNVIEEGKASKRILTNWIYKPSAIVSDTSRTTVIVRARDRTGNLVERRFV